MSNLFKKSAAYAFAMMEFKGKKVLFYIMLATMMIPSQAIIIANYLTIADWGIRNTYAALILPNAAAAFAVFNMRQAFLTLPKEIHEAAEIQVLIYHRCSAYQTITGCSDHLCIPSELELLSVATACNRQCKYENGSDRSWYASGG
mgnify:CR=1 FL=1